MIYFKNLNPFNIDPGPNEIKIILCLWLKVLVVWGKLSSVG